ncbi:DNA translocase FtsK [bacterium]|nr:DNA translocase FtsK [bacterium]
MAKQKKNKSADRRPEILGILLMAFAILILLGLISYHPEDFPNAGSPAQVQNWLGLMGAHISHYLYVYTIGYPCLVFPFLLLVMGWNLFLQQPLRPYFRFSAYLLAISLFLSTALAMPEAVSDAGSKFGFRLSGLLGGFIADMLSRYLGAVGSIVVLLTTLLVILITATSWSMRESLLGFKEDLAALFKTISNKYENRVKHEKKKPQPTIQSPLQSASAKAAEERPRPPIEVAIPELPRSSAMPVQPERVVIERRPHTANPGTKSVQATPEIPPGPYVKPSFELLAPQSANGLQVDRRALEENAHFLEERLKEFDIRGHVVGIRPGPVITRYEIRPNPGVKISRFVNAQDDLALVMRAQRVRVVAPIPGKAAVGIEIPNQHPAIVSLRGVLESDNYQRHSSKLSLALGLTIEGKPYVTDLAEMPHLLVAGATGSGKSVCLNTILASILYKAKPDEVKLVLIDPKKLEMSLYRELKDRHLVTIEGMDEDVITTAANAITALRSLEKEMDKRYRILARLGVRNLVDYHDFLAKRKAEADPEVKLPDPMPYIVLIVDELADLMMTGAREVEEPIARLAQMARAVGIHLILATQRPSVDVITGVIKANFPARIAFQVASKTDSRTILDRNGAEKLLGRGDMLFMHPREPEPIRVHGAFITTDEVQKMMGHIAVQPKPEGWLLKGAPPPSSAGGIASDPSERDELYKEAAKLVVRHGQGSASLLQRRLRVGYARAGRIVDELEEAGILGPFTGSKAREVLVDEAYLEVLEQAERQDDELGLEDF